MKPILALAFLLLALPVAAQEEKARNYQIELSGGVCGFLLRDFPRAYHVGAGLNFPARKPGWYNNFSLNLTRNGQFLENYYDYYTLSAGKHYQWAKGHFYSSLGLNAGLYFAYPGFDQNYYRWINTGIALTPRGELGWKGEKLTVCFGVYMSMGFGYYDNPELDAWHKHDHWLKGLGSLSPYVKIIF